MNDSSSRKSTRASRQRQQKRRERQQKMVSLREDHLERIPLPKANFSVGGEALRLRLQDMWWHVRHNTRILLWGVGILVLIILVFVGSVIFSNQIGYNIWALNMPLSGLSVEEAQTTLERAWQEETLIDIIIEGETLTSIVPTEIGLLLDGAQMAEQAKATGLGGFPFGIEIAPIATLDYATAQTYMLSIIDQVYIPPYEAGYALQDGAIIGVRGRASRELDIALTLENIMQNPNLIAQSQRIELLTQSTPPNIADPNPYLDDARTFIESEFKLIGYDPFENVYIPWTSPPEDRIKWLAAGNNGLVIRENGFEPFFDALNEWLLQSEQARYLDEREVLRNLNEGLLNGTEDVYLRVRYLPTSYTIESGDRGFSIGRKTGLPFGLIDEANPGLNWDILSVGQQINLPSRDLLLQEDPVPNKRIVVDLDRLWLVAYENNEIVFSWPVSSGRSDAPTYPGIFQILEKNDVAYGSSFSLCGEGGTDCAQWTMYWFMGIYEVVPGLMNGFHGAVLLPNGGYLGGGGVRGRTTFGCVMSENSEAELLYNWAEVGTVVEIVSSEFPPRSNLGEQAMEHITQNAY
jgi:LysM repeat protein